MLGWTLSQAVICIINGPLRTVSKLRVKKSSLLKNEKQKYTHSQCGVTYDCAPLRWCHMTKYTPSAWPIQNSRKVADRCPQNSTREIHTRTRLQHSWKYMPRKQLNLSMNYATSNIFQKRRESGVSRVGEWRGGSSANDQLSCDLSVAALSILACMERGGREESLLLRKERPSWVRISSSWMILGWKRALSSKRASCARCTGLPCTANRRKWKSVRARNPKAVKLTHYQPRYIHTHTWL